MKSIVDLLVPDPGLLRYLKAVENVEYKDSDSVLLKKYREALLESYVLGEAIKRVYGINPPTVLKPCEPSKGVRISLNVG